MIDPSDLRLAHGDTTREVIGAFYDVYNEVGHGYSESVYANAMPIALRERGVKFEREVPLAVRFRNVVVGSFRADLIAEKEVLVEYKVVDRIVPPHEGQVLNYVQASGLRVCLILNFGAKATVRRVVGPARRVAPRDAHESGGHRHAVSRQPRTGVAQGGAPRARG
jgi:GxxExxY protein